MNQPVYITAEGEINHNGDLRLAREMLAVARDCGADAMKFLVYRTAEFVDPGSPYYGVFKDNELALAQWRELKRHADAAGIDMYCTPAHDSAVDMLVELGMKKIKIGSTNITNFPLLRRAARTGLDLLLSTGASDLGEVTRAAEHIAVCGGRLALLYHCTALYPAAPEQVDLRAITTLRRAFPQVPVGYSDHTLGVVAAVGAVALGAVAIEKHFTLDPKMPGPDHAFSTGPDDFRRLVREVREVERMLQDGRKVPRPEEERVRCLGRRYVVAREDIAAGEKLTEAKVTVARLPAEAVAGAISPVDYDRVLGRVTRAAIRRGERIPWTVL